MKQKRKSLKNVSNRQFLKNKKLLRRFGLRGDFDNDGVPNIKDCFPFNKKLHEAGMSYGFKGGGGIQVNPSGNYVVFGPEGYGTSYGAGTGPYSQGYSPGTAWNQGYIETSERAALAEQQKQQRLEELRRQAEERARLEELKRQQEMQRQRDLELQKESQLSKYQQLALVKERETYKKAGLTAPTFSQQQEYYGTRTNLTPTQKAYYEKVGSGEITTPPATVFSRTQNVPAKTVEVSKQNTMTLDKNIFSLGRNTFPSGTRSDVIPQGEIGEVFFGPTLIKRQVGTYNIGPSGYYQDIPITELHYVAPDISGVGITERKATKEEEDYFKSRPNILQASTKKPSSILKLTGGYAGTVGDIYNIAETRTRQVYTSGLPELNSEDIMKSVEESQNVSKAPDWMKLRGWEKKAIGFEVGAATAVYEDIRTKPLKNVALFGAGYGLGFATEGALAGIAKIPKIGGGLFQATKVGLYGTGAVMTAGYAGLTLGQMYKAKTSRERGAIFGVAAKDFSLLGFGTSKGVKGYKQAVGLWSTRGRTEYTKIPQGEYPSAKPREHLKLFKENIYPELGEKPIAFHTTSSKFWQEGVIKPSVEQTSELLGLYGSTQISTPFSRISGSSDVGGWSVKDFLTPSGTPAVAGLKPKGFRYSPAKPGKWYLPVKQGYADVPGIKSEIEAIFRPGAGNYGFESGKYYVKIKGVRVPLDVFNYDASLVSGTPTARTTGRVGLYGGRSSYSLPTSSYTLPLPPSISSIPKSPTKLSSMTVTSLTPTTRGSVISSSRVSSSIRSLYSSSVSRGLSSSSAVSSRALSSVLSSTKRSARSSLSSLTRGGSSVLRGPSYYPTGFGRKVVYIPKGKPLSLSLPSYSVSVRRFGRWKPYAKVGSLSKAFELGKGYTTRTLGVSFRVENVGRVPYVPKGYYAKQELGKTIFIEQRGRRLKRGTLEIPEIQSYRRKRVKGGRK